MYRFLAVLLTCWGVICVSMKVEAQSDITSFGGDIYDQGGSLSYSVGQVAYIQHAQSGWQWNQGVQHTPEFGVLSTIPRTADIISVYPNPSHGIFQLSRSFDIDLELAVHDLQGKLVWSSRSHTCSQEIDLHFLSAGVYLLSCKSDKQLEVFKLIRTN